MIKVVSMWRLPEGLSESDFESWYIDKHIGDAKKIPGLRKYTVNRVVDSERTDAPYYRMAELSFDTVEEAKRAFASTEWAYALGDAKDKLAAPIRLYFETKDISL